MDEWTDGMSAKNMGCANMWCDAHAEQQHAHADARRRMQAHTGACRYMQVHVGARKRICVYTNTHTQTHTHTHTHIHTHTHTHTYTHTHTHTYTHPRAQAANVDADWANPNDPITRISRRTYNITNHFTR